MIFLIGVTRPTLCKTCNTNIFLDIVIFLFTYELSVFKFSYVRGCTIVFPEIKKKNVNRPTDLISERSVE